MSAIETEWHILLQTKCICAFIIQVLIKTQHISTALVDFPLFNILALTLSHVAFFASLTIM